MEGGPIDPEIPRCPNEQQIRPSGVDRHRPVPSDAVPGGGGNKENTQLRANPSLACTPSKLEMEKEHKEHPSAAPEPSGKRINKNKNTAKGAGAPGYDPGGRRRFARVLLEDPLNLRGGTVGEAINLEGRLGGGI